MLFIIASIVALALAKDEESDPHPQFLGLRKLQDDQYSAPPVFVDTPCPVTVAFGDDGDDDTVEMWDQLKADNRDHCFCRNAGEFLNICFPEIHSQCNPMLSKKESACVVRASILQKLVTMDRCPEVEGENGGNMWDGRTFSECSCGGEWCSKSFHSNCNRTPVVRTNDKCLIRDCPSSVKGDENMWDYFVDPDQRYYTMLGLPRCQCGSEVCSKNLHTACNRNSTLQAGESTTSPGCVLRECAQDQAPGQMWKVLGGGSFRTRMAYKCKCGSNTCSQLLHHTCSSSSSTPQQNGGDSTSTTTPVCVLKDCPVVEGNTSMWLEDLRSPEAECQCGSEVCVRSRHDKCDRTVENGEIKGCVSREEPDEEHEEVSFESLQYVVEAEQQQPTTGREPTDTATTTADSVATTTEEPTDRSSNNSTREPTDGQN